MSDEEIFESGKQVEEYFNPEEAAKELDSLSIPDEPNPEATQTIETVMEPPVRNKSAAKLAKVESAAVKPVESPPAKAVEVPIVVKSPVPIESVSVPVEESVAAPLPVEKPLTVDEYIAARGKLVKDEYVHAGELAERQFLEVSYRNIQAVIDGAVRLVPVGEPEPEPEVVPVVAEPAIQPIVVEEDRLSVADELHSIDDSIKDPHVGNEVKRRLIRRKLELLKIPVDDSLLVAPPPVAVESVVAEPAKEVKGDKVKKKGMSLRTQLSLLGVLGISGVLIILAVVAVLGH